ncbi:hypothetical protein [Flavobacterium sp. HNIBRBA15423]|uniref:hypothetical protein n=1 Tax=Flavobacterium sp. HNIBRBA15423 TaxID=3458683 RepID=UPI004044D783
MKKIVLLFILFISFKGLCCSCDSVNPIIEFYQSKYVFEGTIISKEYAKDSLTYNVIFDITKHYKNGDNPKNIEFTVTAEGEYTGKYSSCDWRAAKDEKWLVYAREYNNKIVFSGMCSNSKVINERKIIAYEQEKLDNGNSFRLQNYIYNNENCFNGTQAITNIEKILKNGKIKDYEKPYAWLYLYINKNGKLKSVTLHNNYFPKTDTIFNLTSQFNIKLRKPLSLFEKEAIKLAKKIKKWEIKKHKKTNVPVSYIKHLSIAFDPIKKEWKYEL